METRTAKSDSNTFNLSFGSEPFGRSLTELPQLIASSTRHSRIKGEIGRSLYGIRVRCGNWKFPNSVAEIISAKPSDVREDGSISTCAFSDRKNTVNKNQRRLRRMHEWHVCAVLTLNSDDWRKADAK